MKSFMAVLCVLLAFVLTCGSVYAYSETFEVQARDSATREVSLNAGDVLSGRVSLVGNAINFSVTDPDGRVILAQPLLDVTNFQFTALKTGFHYFHFSNEFSDEIKYVTLNYNAQHYVFGYPQEYVILFVIVGFALIGIVVYVAMSPKP